MVETLEKSGMNNPKIANQQTTPSQWNVWPFLTDRKIEDILAVQRLLDNLEAEKKKDEKPVN